MVTRKTSRKRGKKETKALYAAYACYREELDLVLDAVAGKCTSSPRMIRELSDRTSIPIHTTFCATART